MPNSIFKSYRDMVILSEIITSKKKKAVEESKRVHKIFNSILKQLDTK
jgi:hypothetical protein